MRTANPTPDQTPLNRNTSNPTRRATETSAKQTRDQEAQTSPKTVTPKVSQARKVRPSVPIADVPRIKTWLKFGLNMAQAASVYGIDEDQMRNTVAANRKLNI